MIALWKEYVQTTFRRTNFRTRYNGVTRTIYQDGQRLLVLDEYHGELEILAMQTRAGEGRHLGIQEIDVIHEPRDSGRASVKEVRLGNTPPEASTGSS